VMDIMRNLYELEDIVNHFMLWIRKANIHFEY
jgi:hypothetical protein